MRERDRGPTSDYARYAYGYSDKKPWTDVVVRLILAAICAALLADAFVNG